jgi:hypothetical protein
MKDEFMISILLTIESVNTLLRLLKEHRYGSFDDEWVNIFIKHLEANKKEALR